MSMGPEDPEDAETTESIPWLDDDGRTFEDGGYGNDHGDGDY